MYATIVFVGKLPGAEPTTVATKSSSAGHAGARWWSLDIHSHSPASFDYGGLEGEPNHNEKPSFKEWISTYIEAGLDGIVITDHNSHGGIDRAREALDELRQAQPDLRHFAIFPGLELTAAGGTHLLAIFDPLCPADVVNSVLVLCEYQGTRGESDETANKTVADSAKIIAGQGGICIPAHADQDRGVFKIDPRELLSLRKSSSINAVEVVDDSAIPVAIRQGWVPVLGSDSHHLTTDGCPENREPKAPGTHVTLIKAEKLDLDGVRLALTDPSESIRRCRRGYLDPNTIGHGHINNITVVHGGVTHGYRLGPWMNCIIGGRGVGKSTLIELVRLALGRSGELQGPVAKDLRRFHPSAERTERWWDSDTRIVVEYTKDQRLLRVTWSGLTPGQSLVELWEGESWVAQSGHAFDRAPIRVFSQKQIYELATAPQSFLAMVDDMPAIQKTAWKEEYEELQLKLKTERNKLRQIIAEAEKADRIRGQLEEVRGRLRHIAELRATDEYQALVATEGLLRDTALSEQKAYETEQMVVAHASTLRSLLGESLKVAEYTDRATSISGAAELLEQAAELLRIGRSSWDREANRTTWQDRIDQLNTWLSGQGGPSDISGNQTRSDRQKETDLEAKLREVENSDGRRQEQQDIIDQLMEDLARTRSELFTRRREFTKQLNRSNELTRVDVHQQGNVATIGDHLRILLNCPESFESAFSKDGIAASLLDQQPKHPRFCDQVADFKKSLIELVEEGPHSEIGQNLRVDTRFYGRLANADKFDMITNIMLWFPDDLVSVLYRPEKGGNLTPVDRGSPGQKTAALLAVILQMGNDPLLLDQPEDDLENKLIRNLAVETLRSIKTNRQLVVSTHNANIVVTSAAENILVLQHGELLPEIEAEGTLQTLEVKANVCEILEGGEEAITTRYRRLIGLSNP